MPSGVAVDVAATNRHDPVQATLWAIIYARVSSAEQVLGYSIRQQVDRGREWCAENGYEVLAVVTDEAESAQFLEREGLDKARDLVEANPGGVGVVWAQDADRIARDPAHRAFLDAEFERFGTRLFALDDWGDDSHEGELLKYMKGWVAKGEKLKIAERMRRGKMQKAKEGKVVATHRPRYGFRFLKNEKGRAHAYEVREDQMANVRSIFRMVGEEGLTLYAARKKLEAAGIPSPGGKELWHHSYIRDMILDDIYKPHTFEEVAGLVSPEVASKLDPDQRYGALYYDRRRQTKKKVAAEPNGNGRRYRYSYASEKNPRENWVAVPVPNPGIPREWVDRAREAIKNNRRPSSAGLRFWELSGGVLRCASCGRAMQTTSIKMSSGKVHHYYRCPRRVKDGAAGCDNAKNLRADYAEPLVWEKVSELLKDPERLRVGLEAMIEEKKSRASRDPEREAASWHKRLAECARLRAAYQDQQAAGLMTIDELATKLRDLDETRATADRELAKLRGAREEVEALEADAEALLASYERAAPEKLDALSPEERHHVYRLMRLAVTARIPTGSWRPRATSPWTLVTCALLVVVQEFDRVFDAHDVLAPALVDPVDHSRERGGLAAPSWPRDENEAPRLLGHFRNDFRQPELPEAPDLVRDRAKRRAQSALLKVDVDPEAGAVWQRVGQI